MSERAYPLPRPSSGEDPRFTFGLSYEVGQVLESHGFPLVRGTDHVELMQALFRFIYASEALPEPREMVPLADAPIVGEREPAEIVDDGGTLNDVGRDYAEETVPVRTWMPCAECTVPDFCYSGDADCP